MATKLAAAKIATTSGGLAVIANGRTPSVLDRLFAGEEIGTVFLPMAPLQGKRRWIAYAAPLSGRVVVNAGARAAVVERKASLLSAGVERLEGSFEKGDVVLIAEGEHAFARGVVNYGREDADKLVGAHSSEIAGRGVKKGYDALVTRNNIVIL